MNVICTKITSNTSVTPRYNRHWAAEPSGCISPRLIFQLPIVFAHVYFLCLISIYFLFLQTDSVLHLRNRRLSIWQIYTLTPSQDMLSWSDPPGPGCRIKVWMARCDLERSLNCPLWDPIDDQFSAASWVEQHLCFWGICCFGPASLDIQQMSRLAGISNSVLSLWMAKHLQQRQP